MSLTRDEWAKMWESAKTIEQLADTMLLSPNWELANKAQKIIWQTKKIKDQIQSVVGQME